MLEPAKYCIPTDFFDRRAASRRSEASDSADGPGPQIAPYRMRPAFLTIRHDFSTDKIVFARNFAIFALIFYYY